MSNYREKEASTFSIKLGITGSIRLFFFILTHPWEAIQIINEFREEQGKLEEELVALKSRLTDEIFANSKLMNEIYDLKRGGK
jgi:hypothetical protein